MILSSEKSLFLKLSTTILVVLYIIYDIKKSKKEVVEKSEHIVDDQVYTDFLTSLPNRLKLKQKLATSQEKALLILNVDNFSYVNSVYGFEIGDYVLEQLARLLEANVPSNGTLYRIRGDEFAIVLDEPRNNQEVDLAWQLQAFFLTSAINHTNYDIRISFTIGIDRGFDDTILRKADIALQEAREIGKNRFQVYQMNSFIEERRKHYKEWMVKVKIALEHGNVMPFYQPIYNNKTNKIEKYECLARIIDDNKIINPYYFLGPAKLGGFLPYITRITIDRSFSYFTDKTYEFSINITEEDLNDDFFINYLKIKLSHYNIAPERVVLEILEDISSISTNNSIQRLNELKDMGLKIAIDDFGTHNSNFSRVLKLDVEYIKIDGSFIKNIDKDENSRKIVMSINNFAKSVNAKTVAEYVHSAEIQKIVKSLDIDYSQGYYIGEPKQVIEA